MLSPLVADTNQLAGRGIATSLQVSHLDGPSQFSHFFSSHLFPKFTEKPQLEATIHLTHCFYISLSQYLYYHLSSKMAELQSPFMRIPSEIRLLIYEHLFQDGGQRVFEIRNCDPEIYKRRKDSHKRKEYRILGRDLYRQSRATTYQLITKVDIHTSIMAVNKQIYAETAHVLYANRSFGFGRDIEAIVPFLSNLSASIRLMVRGLSIVKQGSVYTRDFDRCEWANACEFLRENMRLQSLHLVVEGGRPALGWEGLPEFNQSDFKTLQSVAYDPLDWVWELLTIKGIQNLEVGSEIHHCPPSHSNAMAFFATFSAAIDKGFTDFLRSEMLTEEITT